MSALTSLLARDRIVLVSKIEEALQHQVLSGGDIETVLLEMNLVAEDVLSAYRAALYDRLPATREETMRASRDAIRSLPRELARRLGAIPLQLEGHTLVVAVVEPLSEAGRAEVVAAVGCDVSERIVTRPRFAAALAHHYGFELEPRMRRLSDALRRREAGVIPFVRPPGPSLRPLAPAPPNADNPFEQRLDTLEYPVVPQLMAPAQIPAGISFSERALPEPVPVRPARTEPMLPMVEVSPSPAALKPPLISRVDADSLSNPVRMSTIPPAHVSSQIARGSRGPLDEKRVGELLDLATQRDEVLFVLLRFAQQFYDFVAIFSIGREGARGRMAHGVGLSPELVERLVVPTEGAGLIARCVRDKRILVGDLSANDEERTAAALLGRPAGRPGIAIPIVLGTRTVIVVYADRVGESLVVDDAKSVAALAPMVADTLRRLIVAQKALRSSSLPPPRASEPPQELSLSQMLPTEPAVSASVSVAPAPASPVSAESAGASASSSASTTPSAGFEAASAPLEEVAELEVVDIDRLSRSQERRRDTRRERPVAAAAITARLIPEGARARLQGVPRTAPPPPVRESLVPAPPAGRTDGSYHYASPSGAILEENTRPQRAPAQGPGPLGLDEGLAPTASVGAAFAQVKPRRIAVEKPRAATADEPPAVDLGGDGKTDAVVSDESRALGRSSLTALPNVISPSVIIDMGSQVTDLVDALLGAGASEEPGEIAELVKVGEAALPVLLQRFPGPLWFDRKEPHKQRPRGRDVSAIARAIVAFGARAAPYLASKVQATDPDTCFYALMVAAEIPHLDLLDAVARRALDTDDVLRQLALEVLRSFAFLPAFETVLGAFAQLSERPGKDPRRQRLAVEALGELRDARSLGALLPRLSDPVEATVQAAHRALVLLTCQDFGLAQRKWEAWTEQWGASHRVEWLMESLMHGDETMRTRAGEELKRATQQYFGYHPQLPKRDRELAQRKYREWWEREGRAAFSAL